MIKLFQYIIIRLTTRHATSAAIIFEQLYQSKREQPILIINYHPSEGIAVPGPGISKKQEMKEALRYLKAKEIKSKQDKSSISMLEGVLVSMG